MQFDDSSLLGNQHAAGHLLCSSFYWYIRREDTTRENVLGLRDAQCTQASIFELLRLLKMICTARLHNNFSPMLFKATGSFLILSTGVVSVDRLSRDVVGIYKALYLPVLVVDHCEQTCKKMYFCKQCCGLCIVLWAFQMSLWSERKRHDSLTVQSVN